MKHFLLFDSGCSLCTELAQAVERESDGLLTARSLGDQEMLKILARVRPNWKHEPTLLQVQDNDAEAFTGLEMRVRLIAILGPQRAYRVAKVVRSFGVSATGFELSRRAFFSYSSKALAGFALLGIPGLRNLEPVTSRPQPIPPAEDLQPGVKELIANNYLSHAAEYPDPNEQVEPLRAYLESDELLRAGKVEEAMALMQSTVAKYPESRHAHAGLGRALWQRYETTQSKQDLQSAVNKFMTADEIGIRFGKVHYTDRVGVGLGQLGDVESLDRYFKRAIRNGNSPYLSRMNYARGLALGRDARAERWFREAISQEPEGVADALAYYAEWLLDNDRPGDVVELINEEIKVEYVHFLKGVALERLGKLDEASRSYKRYQKLSLYFPAPLKYRIHGGKQSDLVFQGDLQPLASESEALDKLSRVISGEARSESSGGQRAVGWTVRTRVFRAYSVSTTCGGWGPSNGCWGAAPSTASLPDKYVAICDSTYRPSICNPQFAQATPSAIDIQIMFWTARPSRFPKTSKVLTRLVQNLT